jgi:predicted permease
MAAAQEFRSGLRGLIRTPGFTVSAVLLLAIGIGANATIFSLINSVLLKPVPGLANAGELTIVARTDARRSVVPNHSFPDYRDLAGRNTVFTGLAAHDGVPLSLGDGGRTDRVAGALASGSYFGVLGVRAAAGRLFGPAEDEVAGRDAVAVISEALWASRWDSDPGIVGRKVLVNGYPFTIAGVAGGRFRGLFIDEPADLWIPLAMHATVGRGADMRSLRDASWVALIGRLRPGKTLQDARTEIGGIGEQLALAYPKENREKRLVVARYNAVGGGDVSGGEAIVILAILGGVAGLALLVICANVANLLIARATARRREIAIRASLGAGRWRIVRQMLIEGAMLSLMGALAGLLVSLWTTDALRKLFPPSRGIDVILDLRPDMNVVLYSFSLAVLSTMLFALAPAVTASRVDLVSALKAGELGSSGKKSRLRSALVVVQVAVGLLLMIGAGLLGRTYVNLKTTDSKISMDNMLLLSVDPETNGYDANRSRGLIAQILERARQVPGVESAAFANMVPFGEASFSMGPVMSDSNQPVVRADLSIVSDGYFDALGIRLLRGRPFREGDTRFAVVNSTLARKLWAGEEPIGKTFRFAMDKEIQWEVIGVAEDIRYASARDRDVAFVYLPMNQAHSSNVTLHVRSGQPLALAESLRQAVREIDPNLPVFDVRTMRAQFERSLWTDRLVVLLLGIFGAVASVVSALGLYAVMSFHVARQTREIGIRIALGASPHDVLRAAVRHGLVLTGAGAIVGVALGLAATQALSSLLYGITPTDPASFAGAILLLMVTAALACYIPARRAARVDPTHALRYE